MFHIAWDHFLGVFEVIVCVHLDIGCDILMLKLGRLCTSWKGGGLTYLPLWDHVNTCME